MFDYEEDLFEALFYLFSPSLRYSAPLWWQSPERSLLCQPPVAVFPHGWCSHSTREKPISEERYAMSKWPHVFQSSHTHFYAGVQKYSTQDAVDRKILLLKYFHWGTGTAKVKCPRINIPIRTTLQNCQVTEYFYHKNFPIYGDSVSKWTHFEQPTHLKWPHPLKMTTPTLKILW